MANQTNKVCCPDCDSPTTFTFVGNTSERGVRAFATKERLLTLAYDVVSMNKQYIREFSSEKESNSRNGVCDCSKKDRHATSTLHWVFTPGLGMSKPMCFGHAERFRRSIDPDEAKDTVVIRVKLSSRLIARCRAAMMLREPGSLGDILPVTPASEDVVIF